jgi:hypothetical protein
MKYLFLVFTISLFINLCSSYNWQRSRLCFPVPPCQPVTYGGYRRSGPYYNHHHNPNHYHHSHHYRSSNNDYNYVENNNSVTGDLVGTNRNYTAGTNGNVSFKSQTKIVHYGNVDPQKENEKLSPKMSFIKKIKMNQITVKKEPEPKSEKSEEPEESKKSEISKKSEESEESEKSEKSEKSEESEESEKSENDQTKTK